MLHLLLSVSAVVILCVLSALSISRLTTFIQRSREVRIEEEVESTVSRRHTYAKASRLRTSVATGECHRNNGGIHIF